MVDYDTLFCYVDDFCCAFEPWYNKQLLSSGDRQRSRKGQLKLSEVLTILLAYPQSSMSCFQYFYFNLLAKRQDLFPNLVSYNRFVRLIKRAFPALLYLLKSLFGEVSEYLFIDSTPMTVCHNLRIHRHQVFKDNAARGKTSTGWFFGFKLHLLFNSQGEIVRLNVTPGNVDDRTPVRGLLNGIKARLIGDKGYISQALFEDLLKEGTTLITRVRKNMTNRFMGMAEIIYPTDSVTGAERHFNNAAQSLFMALAKTLWLLLKSNSLFLQKHDIPSMFSIGNLFVLYNTVSMNDLTDTLEKNLELSKLNKIQTELAHDALAKIRSFMLLGDEGKASVISTFEKQLKLFALPVVKQATDSNSFDFRQLRRQKITIYLSIAPKDLKIASLIINLFFNCAIRINLSENPDFTPELKHALLLILDEFPAIGQIPYVKEAAGYIAGYKIQLLTIFQNVSQLNEIYGDQGRKTLLANHSCKIVFAPNEQEDAEYFSREIAYVTTTSRSKSRNSHKVSVSRGTSESEAKRALMLPQELKQLAFDEEIVLLNGENPIRCGKALYFKDRYFMDKLINLSPTLQEHARRTTLPSQQNLIVALSRGELAVPFHDNIKGQL